VNIDELPQAVRQAYYDALELKLRRCRGDALQKFLGELFARAHGDNFVPATSFYSKGDLKCDGALKEPLTIFACYGPTNGGQGAKADTIANAAKKVQSDFKGALAEWPEMKSWVFVTNFVEGIPPQITQVILELQAAHSGITITQMATEQFRKTIFGLEKVDVEDLLGAVSTAADFRAMQVPEIQTLLAAMTEQLNAADAADDDPVVVPADKLHFNKLPKVYQTKLLQGFFNANGVARYLDNSFDPTLEGKVAAIFKTKYLACKTQGLSPAEIMDALFEFAAHGHNVTTSRDVAIWCVLAYLFEKCIIFEDKPVAA
jgi:hypothetical protein